MSNELNRYVVVCLFNGGVLDFHEKITGEVCNTFGVKRQKLPAHFTIKAPFEQNNIEELEQATEKFCSRNHSYPLTIDNYGHFRDSVVYMDIKVSEEAKKTHDSYIDELKKINWLEWKKNEGKNRVFHCTIVSKLKPEKFDGIWQYVTQYPCHFDTSFDNISILKWLDNRWVTHKKYSFIEK